MTLRKVNLRSYGFDEININEKLIEHKLIK